MEQLIYIEQNDKIEASKMAKNFTIEDTRTRAYVNALGTELATKYLAQENINIANIHNIHSINKMREEFDIADIMLPNIHIDVRVIYDENLIFIPKTHFEYGLTPDIYLVFKMSDETTHVSFLGFFEPKLINKNNSNDGYYFIEKEKLSHPSDLKTYIENHNGNTTESLSDEDIENAQRLAISFIDDNITDDDKKTLISMLTKSATLRENIAEFDNFEWISYHTATNQDFDNIELENEDNDEEILISAPVDEFDVFDNNDEFEQFNEENEELEEEELDTDIVAEALHSIDVIQNEDFLDTIEEDNNIDEFENNETFDSLEELSSIDTDAPVDDIDNDAELETLQIENINTTSEIEEESIENDILHDSDEMITTEEMLENNISLDTDEIDTTDEMTENIFDTELELNDTDLENTSEDFMENISLDDGIQTDEDLEVFDNMLIDNDIESDENTELTETVDIKTLTTDDEMTIEPLEDINENSDMISFNDLPTEEETTEESTINPETANIIDSLLSDDILSTLPPEEEPIQKDFEENINEDNTPSLETIESAVNANEDVTTINFNDMETSDEYKITDENSNNDANETISFENLAETYAVNDELAEKYEDSEVIENIDSLKIDSDVENTYEDDTDFLNALAEESEQPIQEEDQLDVDTQIIPTVFENSIVITNENISVGEIPIDINQPIQEEYTEEDVEKLGVLYNDENANFSFNTNSPEKGKKAIVAAGIIIATLAGLFILNSMNKSDNKIAETQKTNILEKNASETLDKNIPKLPEQKVPTNALTPIEPEDIEKVVAKVPAKDKEQLDKMVKEAKAELAKPKTISQDTPYLEVQKLTWSVPDYLSYNDQFKRYLQTAGKSLKLSLSSDLLLATEYAYSNQITVDVTLTKEGTLKDAKIGQSSGSAQIDAIVLRTVKETLNVVKAPAGLVIGQTVNLTLKIYL